MALAEDDPQGAREAYGVFYSRHASWLLQRIRARPPLMRSVGGDPGAFDLVQDTFMHAYERAHIFDAGDITDPERQQRRVRAWLARIATNLHLDQIRSGHNPASEPTVSIAELVGFDPPEPPTEPDDPHAAQLREAIEKLSEKDQDILWTWAEFYKLGVKHQRLPDEVSQALADRWDSSPEAIRQRRKRLFDQLRSLLTH